MILYKNLSAWYPGVKNKIIEESSFSLQKGKLTALTGLNGSGKTTLIKSMLGLLPYCSGQLLLNKEIQDHLGLNHILKIGYAPEISPETGLFKVEELIRLYLMLRKDWSVTDTGYGHELLIEKFELGTMLNSRLNTLSKGMKKRVMIACAFIGGPEILILDEPFEGLDKNQRINLKSILGQYVKDKYLLISSHELLELKSFCDEFWVVGNNTLWEVARHEI